MRIKYRRHTGAFTAQQTSTGVPVSFHLVSSKLVGNDIDYGLREFRWSGKQAKKFNAITAYYLRAAETKFPCLLHWIYPDAA
uniref:Uncharacterized protein n=1 Tax=Klebsiella pneumoniae TaxID=573 RepID=A0A2P1BNP2_KLEPN|nr:hypothetical protein [Klebsiella pneumoniae]